MRSTTPSALTLLFLLLLKEQMVVAVRNIRIASPLQTLTIWDDKTLAAEQGDAASTTTPRGRFLPKFRAGLQAETAISQQLMEKGGRPLIPTNTQSTSSSDWAQEAKRAERQSQDAEERLLEEAFDRAVAATHVSPRVPDRSSPGRYQFVGVIGKTNEKAITWYARKKPTQSAWTVRLVHVNRDAILQDLYQQGKIDIFARYDNTGKVQAETQLPVIQSQYSVRTRSWKNLWNFSPKHMFTDSSGMYWRERRLRPGLYTDGKTVYEASYRYRDGRNGMKRRSTLAQLMASQSVDSKLKQRVSDRLQKDAPDVVLEE